MNKQTYFINLNQSLDKRLENLENYAKENDVPIIEKEGLMYLIHIIKLTKAKKILEIGTAIGYSAINMALISNDLMITSIERNEDMYKKALENIALFGLENQIQVIFKDALDVKNEDLLEKYDLIFIDAAKGQYQKFFLKYTQLLKQEGIVVSDNLLFHDLIFDEDIESKNIRGLVKKIKSFNEYLSNHPDFDTYFCPIGDGIAVSIKRSE